MKIAIDTADLDCERIDGTRVYLQNVLKCLGKFAPKDEFFLLHKTKYNKLLQPVEFVNYHNRSLGKGFWWTQIKFARAVRKLKADVCWMPIQQIPFFNFSAPGGPASGWKFKIFPSRADQSWAGNFSSVLNNLILNFKLIFNGRKKDKRVREVSVGGGTKYVVTIHDLAFKKGLFPDHFPLIDRLKINFYTNMAVRRADGIIAVSEATKKDLIRFYPDVDENKIRVVYHGFDRKNFEREFSEKEKRVFAKKYGLVKSEINGNVAVQDYLLYVGAIQPRKDLVTLIGAFNKIKSQGTVNREQRTKNSEQGTVNSEQDISGDVSGLKLILVGERAWKSEGTLREIENSEFRDDIIVTGKVDFKELAMFYRLAKIFVFPSLYEGFGIPVLEAMASKTPVVVADNSSLPEIGGEAVLKFETGNSGDLIRRLRKLLANEKLREEMVKRGLERVEKFSWEKCARETLKVLKKVGNNFDL